MAERSSVGTSASNGDVAARVEGCAALLGGGGQPLQMPQHWRRQRRASDVIDSGLSPVGSPLGSSLPREGGPRSPLSPDAGYGGSALPSPATPALRPPPRRRPDQTDASPAPASPGHDDDDPAAGYLPGGEAPMFVEKDAEEYYMRHPRRGHAVIFNNDKFQMPGMAERMGSGVDVKSLEKAYQTLQFEVTTYNNLTFQEIKNILDKLAMDDHSDADCLSITVLTHGMSNGFLLAKDHPYPVQSLWHTFTPDKCPTLAGKPKLFFIQACRGDQLDPGVTVKRRSRTETDSGPGSYKIPSHSDFLLAHSTAEGFFSWRNPDDGTWFIQCLSEELTTHGHSMDILRVLTRVSRRVALEHESFNDAIPWQHQCKQVPCFNSMLIRDLIFHPKE